MDSCSERYLEVHLELLDHVQKAGTWLIFSNSNIEAVNIVSVTLLISPVGCQACCFIFPILRWAKKHFICFVTLNVNIADGKELKVGLHSVDG